MYIRQARPSFTVRVATEELKGVIVPQEDDIITLIKAQQVTAVVGENPPSASAVLLVNDQTQVGQSVSQEEVICQPPS